MTKEAFTKIFDDMGGENYDDYNSHLSPIHHNLQFLTAMTLQGLPKNARILCVGIGTGADMIGLAKTYPEWSFVGLDPAASMLKTCREKLKAQNLDSRCELFHGYLSDYQTNQKFDAVLCLYVMHFVKDMNERNKMYADMNRYLRPQGHLIVAEISADFSSAQYPSLLQSWQAMHRHAGTSEENLSRLPQTLEEQLAVLAPQETEKMIIENGFEVPIQYFQSLLIRAWDAIRKRPIQ